MSTVPYQYASRPIAVDRATARWIWGLLLLLPVLFAWHQSHLQYDVYTEGDWALMLYRASVVAVFVGAAVALMRTYPQPLARVVMLYVALTVLHAVLDAITVGLHKPMWAAWTILFAVMMLPVMSNRWLLSIFAGVNFVLGIVLIALASVPVLHWLDIVSLPYEQVTRVAGEVGEFEYDPLRFGIFGLTENFPYPGHPFRVARLQGFTLEPIHWAYFVFLTAACGMFVLALRKRPARIGSALAGLLLAVHLFFVFSTTGWLGAATSLVVIAATVMLRWRRASARTQAAWAMVLLVGIPGFLIPFIIVQIPDIQYLLLADDLLNKGSNWSDKIGFATLGSGLYLRFLPALGNVPQASHNLVLYTYIKYGYFLTAPLLAFIWMVLRRAYATRSLALICGTLITVVAHTTVLPPEFFWPSGGMCLLLALAVAHHLGPASRERLASDAVSDAPREGFREQHRPV